MKRALDDPLGYCLFDTPIGQCAIAWRNATIARLHLPDAIPSRTAERMESLRAMLQAPPSAVTRVIGRLQRHLGGRLDDLRDIPLDFGRASAFAKRVYRSARAIRPGQTVSYGDLATRVGSPGAARAVGGALGANPIALIVPCHRVLAANRGIGGFSAHGGAATKMALLAIEGLRPPVSVPANGTAGLCTG